MESRVNHEGHEAHEGYDLGAGLKPASKKINLPVLQLRALRALRGEIEFVL
jgi:hypothetical protein